LGGIDDLSTVGNPRAGVGSGCGRDGVVGDDSEKEWPVAFRYCCGRQGRGDLVTGLLIDSRWKVPFVVT